MTLIPKHLVGQPILAAAGFQRHDAPEARCYEPLTAPASWFAENKGVIGAVSGEPTLFVSRVVGFCRKRRSRLGSSVARVNASSDRLREVDTQLPLVSGCQTAC